MLRLCPICGRALTARYAEVSHFRAHVRRGELIEEARDPDGPSFRHPDGGRIFTVGVSLRGRPQDRALREFRERYGIPEH